VSDPHEECGLVSIWRPGCVGGVSCRVEVHIGPAGFRVRTEESDVGKDMNILAVIVRHCESIVDGVTDWWTAHDIESGIVEGPFDRDLRSMAVREGVICQS